MKLTLALIFGGRSAEHEVSIKSAANIAKALDPDRFDPQLIFITRAGQWHLCELEHLTEYQDQERISILEQQPKVALLANGSDSQLIELTTRESLPKPDVLFPILHGPYGEDGAIQGLAKLADLPCVGADVLGSAVGMDKGVTKSLLRDAGIKTAPVLVFNRWQQPIDAQDLASQLGLPVFIKPSNMGSSVGVSKADTLDEISSAVDIAFQYDHKILVEGMITGREIEVSVIGNEEPKASMPGEIKPSEGIYSYDSKYLDEDGAELLIPAPLSEEINNKIRETAIKTYQTLQCSGLARVDVFLTPDDEVYVNEINTLPGFTDISMYPKLWQASGFEQENIISLLIELALEKHHSNQTINTFR